MSVGPAKRATSWAKVGALTSTTAALAIVVACGSDRHGFERVPAVDEAGVFAPADDGGTTCGVVCSRDLHSVRDGCDGTLVEECRSDLGCADGTCVSACRSAERNQGTVGCSFWTIPSVATAGGPPSEAPLQDYRNSCFAAFVANTWSEPVNIHVEYEGKPLDVSKSTAIPRMKNGELGHEVLEGPLPPGEVAIIFLHDAEKPPMEKFGLHVRCPITPAIVSEEFRVPMLSGTTEAFHISTDFPVSAYSIYPYGGALSYLPSATVLLPTSSWDKSYLVVNAWPAIDNRYTGMKPTLQIVANEDDTEVRIRPNNDQVILPDATPASDGKSGIYNLSKGQTLQITVAKEFVGSPIEATKPVGVFGGATCLKFPTEVFAGACDVAQQQIPPLRAWGTEYIAASHESRWVLRGGEQANPARREERVPWRLIGAADGTQLSYVPKRPDGAPQSLQMGESAVFWTRDSFVVRSQDSEHPFYLAAYMSSASFGEVHGPDYMKDIGDPEFVNVVPVQQHLDSYVFFTDMTYGYTTLVVTRHDSGNGFKDVDLDCSGPITEWKNIDEAGRYQYARVTLVREFKPQSFPRGTCENGRHEIRSDEPFALTVWGLDSYASYGYPGGAGLREITSAAVSVPR